ncbi:MAG: Hsp20/alpha crystallin family protein [Candidatus Krumholzibacteria bacterium]|nr:Hsp20/alpha crystallin family protein [Candidatus Krumholzibacteria bacterium]
MELVRWNPRRDIVGMHGVIDRMFDGFFDLTRHGLEFENVPWAPHVNIEESDEMFEVTAEVPGMEKDGIKIEVRDHVLALSGENKINNEKKDKNIHVFERCYGRFERAFKLPENVDTDKIEAEYKNGILKIDIPKTKASKPKEIKVN